MQAMNTHNNQVQQTMGHTLILDGTGKTGRRIANKLEANGMSIRIGSRSAFPAFDWNQEASWGACLIGIEAVYITYVPDLAVPGATDTIQAFVDRAVEQGVKRLVLLSGRGEAEAQACERIVQNSGLDWTIVRASWFHQNFSEGAFLDMVQAGQITLPTGTIQEPFVDVEDIADVAVAALSEPGHTGEIYEVTGPRLMTFKDVADELSAAIGHEIHYTSIPHKAFLDGVRDLPEDPLSENTKLVCNDLSIDRILTTDEHAVGRHPLLCAYRSNHLGTGCRRIVCSCVRSHQADCVGEGAADGAW